MRPAPCALQLAGKMHAAGKTVGLDLSGDCGGSPIDLYDVFNSSRVDTLMLMAGLQTLGTGYLPTPLNSTSSNFHGE